MVRTHTLTFVTLFFLFQSTQRRSEAEIQRLLSRLAHFTGSDILGVYDDVDDPAVHNLVSLHELLPRDEPVAQANDASSQNATNVEAETVMNE